MKYQYTMLRLNFKDPQKTLADLNQAGEEGWDLTTIWPDSAAGGIAILKRPLRVNTPPAETFEPTMH
jgi:hypothetical protein